jgi:hypothetical protein
VSPLIFHASFDDTLDAIGAAGPVKPVEITGKVEYRDGKLGRALLCGGDAALLKYPVAGHVRPGQGTVEMWVQTVDWPPDEQAFHVFCETEGPGWLVLYKFWTGGLLMLSGTDHEHYGSAWWEGGTLSLGAWHHLAGVWAKSHLAIYVDGVLKKRSTLPPLPPTLAGRFTIGDAGWGKPHASHTLLDEVKVYRYALPPEEIAKAARGEAVTYRPNLPIDVEPHPARGQWKLTVDGAGTVGDEGPGRNALVEIVTQGKTTASAQIAEFADGMGTAVVDIAHVPVGEHFVRVTIADTAGKQVARTETPFTRPPDAPWLGNRIGLEDRVLSPLTELTVGGVRAAAGRKPTGTSVECWGRKCAMNGLLPTQIESAGQPMLAAPIRLVAETAAGPIDLQLKSSAISGWSPTRARHAASAEGGGLAVRTESTLEYDGMLWTDLTLTPARPLALTGLTLHIPLRAANAIYVHHVRPSWLEDNAGRLPDQGYEAPAFQPFLWLGDDDRGLAWFAESDQGWSNVPGKPVERVTRNGDVVDMEIHFITQPTKFDRPLRLSFGLQATPVKPRPAGARGWRLGNLGTSDNLDDPSMGNLQVIWSNGNLAYYGYPAPKDPDKFRKLVADLHARQTRVIPYVNLNFLSSGAPEWPYYNADFRDPARSFTSGDVREMGFDLIGACPHTAAWRDLIAYKLAAFVDEFHVDGIYVDCWNPAACLVEDHGCGWRDAAGNLHGRFPIRDCREIVRRVRELLLERRPDPHIIIHMSTSVTIPMLAFADSMLDGEQYQASTFDPKDDYLGIVPLDKWRAENTGRQWGIAPFFLPELAGKNRVEPLATQRLMGLMLAHDASPWPIWCRTQTVFDVWKMVDRFGIADADFLPYWKPNGITTSAADVLVSAYRKPGSALLVVLNAGKADAELVLKVDPRALGLGSTVTARAGDDGPAVATTADGLKLTVPGRGFRLVVLQ